MIGEQYLQAAVNIRKTYLRVSRDLSKYQEFVESSLREMQRAMAAVDGVQKKISESRKAKEPSEGSTEDLLKILSMMDDESKRIEEFIDPLNKEIEKLAKEEQILYERICEAHPDLDEATIIYVVRTRLKQENLM